MLDEGRGGKMDADAGKRESADAGEGGRRRKGRRRVGALLGQF
jgi:hypothetical protein